MYVAVGHVATEIKIKANNTIVLKSMNGNKIPKFSDEKEIPLNGVPINHIKTDTKVSTTGCI